VEAPLFGWLIQHVSWGWTAGAILVLWVFGKTGVIQNASRARTSERDQLSEDQQSFLKALVATVERERQYRVSDAEWYQKELAGLRAELVERDKTIAALAEAASTNAAIAASSERGNARLRHGLNGACIYIDALRAHMHRSGLAPVPFDGWRDLLGIMPDLDAHLTALFGEGDKRE
jgi:hypothetical protein